MKFGCRLKPVVVSLLRLLRPSWRYSSAPVPASAACRSFVKKLRRGNTWFGSWLTSDGEKPSSAGIEAQSRIRARELEVLIEAAAHVEHERRVGHAHPVGDAGVIDAPQRQLAVLRRAARQMPLV